MVLFYADCEAMLILRKKYRVNSRGTVAWKRGSGVSLARGASRSGDAVCLAAVEQDMPSHIAILLAPEMYSTHRKPFVGRLPTGPFSCWHTDHYLWPTLGLPVSKQDIVMAKGLEF